MLSPIISQCLLFPEFKIRRLFLPSRTAVVDSLLNGPLHSLVCNEEGDTPVEDLTTGAAESVEDSSAHGAGKGVLTVLGEAVVDNALLGKGA